MYPMSMYKAYWRVKRQAGKDRGISIMQYYHNIDLELQRINCQAQTQSQISTLQLSLRLVLCLVFKFTYLGKYFFGYWFLTKLGKFINIFKFQLYWIDQLSWTLTFRVSTSRLGPSTWSLAFVPQLGPSNFDIILFAKIFKIPFG